MPIRILPLRLRRARLSPHARLWTNGSRLRLALEPSGGGGKKRRNVDDAIEASGAGSGAGFPALEASLQQPKHVYSHSWLNIAKCRGNFHLDWLLRRDGVSGDLSDQQRQEKLEALKIGDQSWIHDWRVWVPMLHGYAVAGEGRVARPSDQNSFSTSSAVAASSSSSSNNASAPLAATADAASSTNAFAPLGVAATAAASSSSSAGGPEPSSSSDAQDDAPPTTEEATLIRTLKPPPPGSTPLSLTGTWLSENGLPRASYDTVGSVYRMLKRNARVQGWYETAKKEKLWVEKAQITKVVTAIWGTRGHNSSGLALAVTQLSHQLFIQLLDQDGIRAKSWADANDRKNSEEGIYWRWGDHTRRLIGYDEADRPLLLSFGSTTASKQKGPAGNKRPGHYAFGSRSADSAADDINLTLVLLAIFSEYDESFARALLGPGCGKEPLRGKPYKEWKAVDAPKNSPVLVEYFYRRKSSRAVLKHAMDKLALGFASIDNVCPLGNLPRH